jgi:hypothetical protein
MWIEQKTTSWRRPVHIHPEFEQWRLRVALFLPFLMSIGIGIAFLTRHSTHRYAISLVSLTLDYRCSHRPSFHHHPSSVSHISHSSIICFHHLYTGTLTQGTYAQLRLIESSHNHASAYDYRLRWRREHV